MDIYFVRHGETAANAARRYQPPTEVLSDKGVRDVAKLVRTVQEISPTHLYTSTYARARETARYLGYATELEPEWHEHVHEVSYPDIMLGRRHYSLATCFFGLAWFLNIPWLKRLAGVETRHDFFTRIKMTQQFFEENHDDADVILVVSHSFFINSFVMHLCREHPMQLWHVVPHVFRVLRSKNTGLTHIRYSPTNTKNVCSWELISFDQGTHLEI